MKFRLIESVFVIALVAMVMAYLQQRPPAPAASPTPKVATTSDVAPRLISEGDNVPSFLLSDPEGGEFAYTEGQGPILVVLTATGCGGCLDRIDGVDRQAYKLAKAAGVPVWNMLVYQSSQGAPEFLDNHHPSADQVLCDSKAAVSVQTLGGSDATCWLLIDQRGRLAWRGPAELDGLKSALAKL